MADAMKVIDILKKTIADLTVQNVALSVDLEEAQTKLAVTEADKAQEKK